MDKREWKQTGAKRRAVAAETDAAEPEIKKEDAPSPRQAGLELAAAEGGSAVVLGVDALIAAASHYVWEAKQRGEGTGRIILRLADEFAFIRLGDVLKPLRFLKQMEGVPPLQVGTDGFRTDLVDDQNPARHYLAFVFLGYWLPGWAALAMIWLWEIAGFVRYGGEWSWPDVASGNLGVRHGQLVRRYGATILPMLIAAELAEPSEHA